MTRSQRHLFPSSRLATIDICYLGRRKHHIPALLEVDVSHARSLLKAFRKENGDVSFTAWLVKVIAHSVHQQSMVAAYLDGKRTAMVFDDVHVSFLIEKERDGQRIPMPLLIACAQDKSLQWITANIKESKEKALGRDDIVLQKESSRLERLYYWLPTCLRRWIWRQMLRRPGWVFPKMGNVAITALGMAGKIQGWFIPLSVHPVCFGLGSVIRKPVVVGENIEIRDILHMSVLMDHNVVDGVAMARFLRQLTSYIEQGAFLTKEVSSTE